MWDNIQNLLKRMDKKFRILLQILKATDVAITISYVRPYELFQTPLNGEHENNRIGI